MLIIRHLEPIMQMGPPRRGEGRKAKSRYIGKPMAIATEPDRKDYVSRQAYRAAMRKWAEQQEPKP